MKDKVRAIGDFDWKQMKDYMIQKLREIQSEEEFGHFIKAISTSIGKIEDIVETRKRLGIKPLTKEEIEEMKK